MKDLPLVTAIMITGMHEVRYGLARIAMECFRRQTYPNRELLIINHGPQSLATGESDVREIRIQKKEEETVGDLRNLALDKARGEFAIVWDDDDWYAPDRISVQMAAQSGSGAVALCSQIRYSLISGNAFCIYRKRGIAGTLLHPRGVGIHYPSMVRGSDTFFLESFGNVTVLNNDPELYIRFYHGLNLWGRRHVMGKYALPFLSDRLDLNSAQCKLLTEIIDNNINIYSQFSKRLRKRTKT